MIRAELNIESNDNSLFVTSQCNNHCLMCSQPPLERDDIDFFFEKNLSLLSSAPSGLTEIGITGGEPTLLGERLFDLIGYIQQKYPEATIHILSNGRGFAHKSYAERLSEVGNGRLIVGVPLHSDFVHDHDWIAQAKGAYNETMKGLYHLAEYNVGIELRIVINKLNYIRLPQLSDFIFKNLPFVRYVSFMGLEVTGYAIKNYHQTWIEPQDFIEELEKAVIHLATWGMNVSVFNLPLCCLPDSLHEFACKSISDWKVKYLSECTPCKVRNECCGLFGTSKNELKIQPFL
ncbi:MAG: His-Xaa-Ser system radical SAM maturase HxsC [Bacteroides sp.]|nr:His-Xaa-Ser system radical SAM maturase HxsC [Bacteroides sp.]